MSDRKETMKRWLDTLAYDLSTLEVASEDASFRRYFRIKKGNESYIVMDAPPQNESCDSFISLANSLTAQHINAPKIFAQDLKQGFLVLSDFGDDLLLGVLDDASADGLYGDAMNAILQMQNNMPNDDIVAYSADILDTEMELFKQWFIEKLLGINFNQAQLAIWQQTKQTLIQNALVQPQFFVHRDFHSRNLIKTPKGKLGIIDFQDAVKGPITYDLVSLLRDCYIAWPAEKVNQWMTQYYEQSLANKLHHASRSQFKTWFNLMGVQRHLKAIGIFSRLKLRDNKSGYIADIPRTLAYVNAVSQNEASLEDFNKLLGELALLAKADALLESS